MARKRWLRFVAGTGLVLTIGCHTPNGPTGQSTLPPPNFNYPKTSALNGAQPLAADPKSRIGTPIPQSGQMPSPKLGAFNPAANTGPQTSNAFPTSNPGNPPRTVSTSEFNDAGLPSPMNPPPYRVEAVPPQQLSPPPAINGLPSSMPNPAFPANSASFPQPNFPAPSSSQVQFPAMPPSPPDFPPPNVPSPSTLSIPGPARTNTYQVP
jgi:hypothetical protein